jgi:hypothetical protein
MTEKIIIENRSSLNIIHAIPFITEVILGGRVSGEGEKAQYCYHTFFPGVGIHVSAYKNKASDRFVVYDE